MSSVTVTSQPWLGVLLGAERFPVQQEPPRDFYTSKSSSSLSLLLHHATSRQSQGGLSPGLPPGCEEGTLQLSSLLPAAGMRGRGSSVPRNRASSCPQQPYGEPCSDLPRR